MTPPQFAITTKKTLEKLISSLIGRGIADDQNSSFVRQLSANAWEVSFNGAEHISFAMGKSDYNDIHKELSERRSYNAKLIDGGLLQIMYLFEENQLIKHRLAYLPSPNLRPFREDPEDYLHDELYLDIVSRCIVPFPLRFDFDEGAARDVEHPRCHLTLGDVKNCRIPVSAPLTPRWFIGFILRNFYQTNKFNLISALPHHQFYFPQCITVNEREIIHFVVPDGDGHS